MISHHFLSLLTSVSLASFVVACSSTPDLSVQELRTTDILTESTSVERLISEQSASSAPNRIVVVKDNTLSREQHHLPPMTLDAVQPLLDLLKQYGGEFALITLCDRSDRPAERVYIATPPTLSPSALHQTNKPTPPDTKGISPFQLEDIQQEYQDKQTRYQQQQAENKQIVAQHQAALAQWEQDSEQTLETFSAQIKPLLEAPATCRESNVWEAILRSDSFLIESHEIWAHSPKNFLLLLTDGLHNTDTPPVQMEANAEVVLVSGSGESGVFGSFHHQSFEAVDAAVRYIVDRASHEEADADE